MPKINKNITRLFLLLIISSFIAGILHILISNFLIISYYPDQYRLICLFIDILQNIIIAYLTVAFYKKKLSPRGEYYTIFKITLLLIIFNFLYQLFLGYVAWQAPNIFFSNLVNVGFALINLALFYLLSCIIYNFDKKILET